MSFRPLSLGASAALVLASGLVLATPVTAADKDFPNLLELAQAPPAPPQAAGHDRRAFAPQAMCKDMVARRIGNRAYLKARLDLKPEQMTQWNAFEKASDEASAKAMARCATLPAEMKDRPDYVQRLNMEEDVMKARVAAIEAVKPSLVALVGVLTPEQKSILDQPRGPGLHRMGGHMGGKMGGPGPR